MIKYIVKTDAPPYSLEQFATKNDLTMLVCERNLDKWAKSRNMPRYYANFDDVEVKDGCMLCGEYGNGNTPEEAIANYAGRILGCRLVYGAYGPNRREFIAPNEWIQ